MSQKSFIISNFEEDFKPFFVVYGSASGFDRIMHDFCTHFQKKENTLYLALDMKTIQANTLAQTLFEIAQQLGEQLVKILPATREKRELDKTLSILQSIKKVTKDHEHEKRLANFIVFTDLKFHPIFHNGCKEFQSIVIGFEGFEIVSELGSKIRNYLLDRLLRELRGVNLRFVFFVHDNDKPRLFYGSNEEMIREQIAFINLTKHNEKEEFYNE